MSTVPPLRIYSFPPERQWPPRTHLLADTLWV